MERKQNMKKKLNLVLFLLLLCMAAGCDKKTVSTDGIRIYYRALSENGISSYYYKPTGTDQETVINELWAKLIKSDTEKARISLIPSDLKLVRFQWKTAALGFILTVPIKIWTLCQSFYLGQV